jgi:hypothetical protein
MTGNKSNTGRRRKEGLQGRKGKSQPKGAEIRVKEKKRKTDQQRTGKARKGR